MSGQWGAGPAVVYRCFADEEVLYVGATTDLEARMVQHKQTTEWAWRVTQTETTDHDSLRDARDVESAEILRLRPRWNIAGRGPRVSWKLADYAEVMLAVHARREQNANWDIYSADKKIEGLQREFVKRYPDVAPLIIADLTPYIPKVSAERSAAWEAQRAIMRERIDRQQQEAQRRQEWVREQDRLDLIAERMAEAGDRA